MPCYHPLQVRFTVLSNGKYDIRFSEANSKLFKAGIDSLGDNNMALPCGKCIGCKLENSRQKGMRALHQSKMHSQNSFITLTFGDDFKKDMCPNDSVVRKHVQDFNKRLRDKFSEDKFKVMYCGEYGKKFERPHYHELLFGLDFSDKYKWTKKNGFQYYRSNTLEKLWPFGNSIIGDLTFESACYVARYCVKKITGDKAKDHYGDREPEFGGMSNRPALGKTFFDKFGFTDIYPRDECVVRGFACKPPRYYDKLLERSNPEMYLDVKKRRVEKALAKADDNTFERLRVKEKCLQERYKRLVRSLDYVESL